MTTVYAIAWSDEGPTKIGIADKPVRRLMQLQTSNSNRLRIYFAAEVGDKAFCIEQALLSLAFADKLMIGEWVNAPPAKVREQISRQADMLGIKWTRWIPTAGQRKTRERVLNGLRGIPKARKSVSRQERQQRLEKAYAEARELHREIGW